MKFFSSLALLALFACAYGATISNDLSDEDSEGERGLFDIFKEAQAVCEPKPGLVSCSFQTEIFGNKLAAGITAKVNPGAKSVGVSLDFNGASRFSKEFSYSKLERVCKEQAIPHVGTVEVCLETPVTQDGDKIMACPSVFFYYEKDKVDGDHWAQLIFNCPTFTGAKVDWTRPRKPDGSDNLKDNKYIRFKTHGAVKKAIKVAPAKIFGIINEYILKKKD